jgi:hypothetical protein
MAYGGVEVQAHHFFTSELDGGEWSDSHLCRCTTEDRAPGTHWIGDRARLTACLAAMKKRRIFYTCRESNPGNPARSLVAIPTELSYFLKLLLHIILSDS